MADHVVKMSDQQSLTLQRLNDQYGAARWEREGTDLHIWFDDDDEALVDRQGYVTWKSVAP